MFNLLKSDEFDKMFEFILRPKCR